MPKSLTAEEVETHLKTLTNWHQKDNALERVFTGENYLSTLNVLNSIAQLAEEQDHHPDLTLSYTTLTIRYWTHTTGGITELDIQAAHDVDNLLQSFTN